MRSLRFILAAAVVALLPAARAAEPALYERGNLVAWCIVPFDAKKRGPEERAAMLERLGLRRLAYDWRAEHVPTFDAEMLALKKHGVELTAWWFPTAMGPEARAILDVIDRHGVRPQLWVMGAGEPKPGEVDAHVQAEVARLAPICEEAGKRGLKVGLYNHGGWFGEPENQVRLIGALGRRNVGIVYNLHHGHAHLDRLPALLTLMKPHLLCVNLNGMDPDGEARGRKILPLGEGKLDEQVLRQILESGWRGPVGVLNHTDEDAEVRLRQNLRGLETLATTLKAAAGKD